MNHPRIWLSRILIGIVLLWNVQCALAFIWSPDAFAPSFELSGAPGAGMVRGMGVLFLMWNVPYAVALFDPVRRRLSLYEAIAMQTIGLLGESLILWGLPGEHLVVRQSVLRFIAFDGSGLVLLLLAAWFTRARQRSIQV
ncbi:MAG: hypothetical protein AB1894_01890 [Chloroflexota bacterium]